MHLVNVKIDLIFSSKMINSQMWKYCITYSSFIFDTLIFIIFIDSFYIYLEFQMNLLARTFTQIIARSTATTNFFLKPSYNNISLIFCSASTESSQESMIKERFLTIYFLDIQR
jgi:hypothetical protein